MFTNSQKETLDFGKKLAKTLKPGDIIGLKGDLGAGKTVLTKGIASGLGIKKTVNSPTFVVMKVYPLKQKNIKNLIHIDAYRIKNSNDFQTIGIEEYLEENNNIIIIEWIDNIKTKLPKKIKYIDIKYIDKDKREICLLDSL